MARRPPARPAGRATRPTRAATPPPRKTGAARAPARPLPVDAPRPDVIVDFTVEHGLLFVVLRNIGAASAYAVVTRFDRPLHGLGGARDLSTLALFRSLPFMPPGKQFTQLVDPVAAWFGRGEPTRLTATLTYTGRDGRRYSEVIPHDLDVYRDLAEAMPR